MNEFNLVNLKGLKPIPVNHGNGFKKVFKANDNLNNNLTQIAYGEFVPGEKCKMHVHPTMDEYFFFIKGEGKYIIENNSIEIKPGTFLEIKAGNNHKLIATGNTNLEFVYWGIAL